MCSHTHEQPAEPEPEPYDDPLKHWKAAQPVRKKKPYTGTDFLKETVR